MNLTLTYMLRAASVKVAAAVRAILAKPYTAPLSAMAYGPLIAAAWVRVGGLSKPSKMPGYAISLPATACNVGGILSTIAGTVCSGCYALKGRYVQAAVLACTIRRYLALDSPTWVDDMILLLHWYVARTPSGALRPWLMRFFRWHDSGDLQSVEHLAAICRVAAATPEIRHWLPTRELSIVNRYQANGGTIPDNLRIRISGTHVDRPTQTINGLTTSEVRDAADAADGSTLCPAYTQDGKCGTCRACWLPTPSITYPLH